MFAVVETGGKQYKVAPGDLLDVERLDVDAGQQFDLGRVLMVGSDGGEVMVGKPIVEGARVLATVITEHRGEKLIVFKYKPKKRYRRKTGHRQTLTRVSIDSIVADGLQDEEKVEASTTTTTKTSKVKAAPAAQAEQTIVTATPVVEVSGVTTAKQQTSAAQQAVDNIVAEDALAGRSVADMITPLAHREDDSETVETAEANLEWVNGIGPKYNEVLAEHGIRTDADLANATLEQLKATGISHESDEEFESWIQQAKDKLAGE